MNIDAKDMLDFLAAQRNKALDELVTAKAEIEALKRELFEANDQLGKLNKSDTENAGNTTGS